MRSRRFSTGSCKGPLCAVLLIPLVLMTSRVPAGGRPVMGILRFRGASADTLTAAYRAMLTAARKDRFCAASQPDASAIAYAYDTGNVISAANLARYMDICNRLKCTHLLMGRVVARNKELFLEAKVFSAPERAYICTLVEPVAGKSIAPAASTIVTNASLSVQGTIPVVSGLNVSRGAAVGRVSLSWLCSMPGTAFTISRSYHDRSPTVALGETKETSYTDTTAEPGIKSWYTVTPAKSGMAGAPVTGYGYSKPPNPRSLTVDEMLDPRTRPWPPDPPTQEERDRQKLHLELMEKYYESYFMATFIVMVGKMYINSGDLLAYRDFHGYTWDPGNRIVYFSKPGVLTVKFFSKRFFRFVRDMYSMKIPFDELMPRIVANGILFCVRSGETETHEASGRVRYLPNMEAVGMSTEYVRDYEKWRSTSVVFATSDQALYKRIRDAEAKGY